MFPWGGKGKGRPILILNNLILIKEVCRTKQLSSILEGTQSKVARSPRLYQSCSYRRRLEQWDFPPFLSSLRQCGYNPKNHGINSWVIFLWQLRWILGLSWQEIMKQNCSTSLWQFFSAMFCQKQKQIESLYESDGKISQKCYFQGFFSRTLCWGLLNQNKPSDNK